MRRERQDHTLQPTALINEAYLRLFKDRDVGLGRPRPLLRNRRAGHAADPGRPRAPTACAQTRDGRTRRSIGLHAGGSASGQDIDVLALHEALDDLAVLDPRQAEIVELRYFGGLTEQEVATVKKLSPATIRREVAAARFWLGRRMKGGQ